MADKIRQSIESKMKEGLYELELIRALPVKKLEVLDNLV